LGFSLCTCIVVTEKKERKEQSHGGSAQLFMWAVIATHSAVVVAAVAVVAASAAVVVAAVAVVAAAAAVVIAAVAVVAAAAAVVATAASLSPLLLMRHCRPCC